MKTQRHLRRNEEPVLGNRSKTYIGINAFLDPSLFQVTRDGKFGAPRCDPRLMQTPFQREMRDAVCEMAKSRGLLDMAPSIWECLIKEANEVATDHVCGRKYYYEPVKITKTELRRAIIKGESYLRGRAHELDKLDDFWSQWYPDAMLPGIHEPLSIENNYLPRLYLFVTDCSFDEAMLRPSEKVGWKIGETRNFKDRIRSYQTKCPRPVLDCLARTDTHSDRGLVLRAESFIKKITAPMRVVGAGTETWFSTPTEALELYQSAVKMFLS